LPILIDTDVAIHLRDGDPDITRRLDASGRTPIISAVTMVELLGGVAVDQSAGRVRARLLTELLRFVPVMPFTDAEAQAYGEIVAHLGHDRRRVLDRMIAAQAIVAGLPLATINGRDFADVPGLVLEVWAAI
jgi:predicted nucleic acid-binding protein